MSLAARGLHAICFNSETVNIPTNIIYKLTFRFKHIVLLYDTDKTGMESSKKHEKQLSEYGVKRLLLPLAGTKEEKDIWLVGGGELTTMLLNCDLIDEMQLCQVPMILSKGLPLFPNNPLKLKWTLKDSKSYDTGLVIGTYEKI